MLNASTTIGRPSKNNGKKEVDRVVMLFLSSLSLSLSRGLRHEEKVACAREQSKWKCKSEICNYY